MKPNQLVPGIHRVYARIGSRDLFEGIWPIEHGVLLNSYVVQGSQKTAFIDLVKDWEGAVDEVEGQLASLGLSFSSIDYLVLNHMEPDHTGSLGELCRKNPSMKILCTKKAVPLVKAFYGITEQVQAVTSGDSIDLGGKTLVFEETPNIH